MVRKENFNDLATPNLNNIRYVGNSRSFQSLQSAHDDLPSAGGMIYVTESISETGIVFSKPIKLVGVKESQNNQSTPVSIDVSGGNGIWAQVPCTIRDVAIVGDGGGADDGYYGLRLGQTGVFGPQYRVEGTSVEEINGTGVEFRGGHQEDVIDIQAQDCAGRGWWFNLTDSLDFFNQNTLIRMSSNHNEGLNGHPAIEISGGNPWQGNVVLHLHAELNNGDGFVVNGDPSFNGNMFYGYGFEANSGTSLDVTGINDAHGNVMRVRRADSNATINYDVEDWDIFEIAAEPHQNLTGSQKPICIDPNGNPSLVYDDFSDNRQTDRIGMQTGQYTEFSTGDTKRKEGCIRPPYNLIEGSVNFTGGAMVLPSGTFGTQTNEVDHKTPGWSSPTGSFEITYQYSNAPSTGSFRWWCCRSNQGGYLRIRIGGGTIYLDVEGDSDPSTNGVISYSGGSPSDTNEHTIRLERDANGNVEFFFDGSSVATGSDSVSIGERNFMEFQQASDAEIQIKEYRVW